MAKLVDLSDAVTLVPDGTTLGVGGVLLKRKPMAFLWALVDAGVRDLTVLSFLASLDVELLAAHRMLDEVHTGYVGFEQFGFAPAFEDAVGSGRIRAREYTELLFVTGLRAAQAGLPFLPTKGGWGSALVTELGLQVVADPYGGESVLAVPALRPAVTVIHASEADEEGNVLGPASRDFLFDADITMARASGMTIVTAEAIVDRDFIRAQNHRTMLYGYEVDAVVHLPGGARPSALPGWYQADLPGIQQYLERTRAQPSSAVTALGVLR
jgi:acyl CoA:acetate/3-ketoacid CoA transferase alpha subunit